MGLLSFSSPPNKKARLSVAEQHPSSRSAPARSGHNHYHLDTMFDRNLQAPPRLFEPLCQLGPTLTASLLASPPRQPPVTPAPPEPLRTTPGDQPVGTPRRRMSLKRWPPPSSRPMSHYLPSLPPGAAAPYLGGVLDQFNNVNISNSDDTSDDEMQRHPMRRSSLKRGSLHLRSISASALESLGTAPRRAMEGLGHQRRPSSKMSLGPPPAIPPRSHLRALVASGGCVPSSSQATTDESPASPPPPPPQRTPPRPSMTSSATTNSTTSLQYVLDVELPSSSFSKGMSFTTEPLAESSSGQAAQSEQASQSERASQVISFGSNHYRRRNVLDKGGVMNPVPGKGDPFRVRDGKPARASPSGVYTPKTFPGPQGHPSRAIPASPTSPPQKSSFTMSAPTSPYNTNRASQQTSGARVRSLSGFKRFSLANSNNNSVVPPVPTRHSHSGMGTHTPSSSMSHAPTLSYSSQASQNVLGESHSPSSASESAHSFGSASPPETPTTPISAKAYFAQNGVVVIGRDGVDSQSLDSLDSFGLGFDTTPKVLQKDLPSSPTVTSAQTIPISDRTTPVPLSPDAPKRARRKPVPRLVDDDVVPRLEAIQL